jgi:two-component system, NarL family, invasion response regulator UvrY
MIKIMVIDGHHLVRAAIVPLLAEYPDLQVVAEAQTAEEALSFIPLTMPDVVFMDLSMPGMGGLQGIKQIKIPHPGLKIMVLSSQSHEPHITLALQAGAKGYLSKSASPAKMHQAIHTVMQGKIYLEPTIAQTMVLKPFTASPLEALSEREKAVFKQIAQGTEPQLIAEQLGIHIKTLNTYRYRIQEKLQVTNDVQMALLAIGYGLFNHYEVETSEDGVC